MNKNFYSATMLTRYIKCKNTITNEFNEKKLNLKRFERTVADNLRLEKGLLHEVDYFKELSKKYKISRERVRQIENKAFEKLQKHMLLLAKSKNLLPSN